MPREKVDRPAFAEHGVRNLGLDHPSELGEQAGQPLAQLRVPAIDKAVDIAAAPPNVQDQLGIEHGEEAPEATDRHRLDPAPLRP